MAAVNPTAEQLEQLKAAEFMRQHNGDPMLAAQTLAHRQFLGQRAQELNQPMDASFYERTKLHTAKIVLPFQVKADGTASFKLSEADNQSIFPVRLQKEGVRIGNPADVAIMRISRRSSHHQLPVNYMLSIDHARGLVNNDVYHPNIGRGVDFIPHYTSEYAEKPVEVWKCQNLDLLTRAALARTAFGSNSEDYTKDIKYCTLPHTNPKTNTTELVNCPEVPISSPIWQALAHDPQRYCEKADISAESFPMGVLNPNTRIVPKGIYQKVCEDIDKVRNNATPVHPYDLTFRLTAADKDHVAHEIKASNGKPINVTVGLEIQYYLTDPLAKPVVGKN